MALDVFGQSETKRACAEGPVRNPNQQPRIGLLRDSAIVLGAIRSRIPIRKGLGIVRSIMRLTSKAGVRPPLPSDFHDELADYFRRDVALLGDLLRRDFSAWLNTPLFLGIE